MVINEFITKEQAVSYLLGLGETMDTVSVSELTEAIAEVADVNAENWLVDNPSAYGKSLLNGMANIAETRVALVNDFQNLVEDIIDQAIALEIKLKQQENEVLLDYDSFADWVNDNLYIDLPVRQSIKLADAKWENVTIKIKDGNKLQIKLKNHKTRHYSFAQLGLMASNKYEPNYLGGILIGLSLNHRYPPIDEESLKKHVVNISKLNKKLKEKILISDTSAPIKNTESKGYIPSFKLIYDLNSRDRRAKADATLVSFNDELVADFDDEDDDAANFIKNNPL